MYTAVTRIKNKPYKILLFKHGRDGKEAHIYSAATQSYSDITKASRDPEVHQVIKLEMKIKSEVN